MVESGSVSWVERRVVHGGRWFSVLGKEEGSPWSLVGPVLIVIL